MRYNNSYCEVWVSGQWTIVRVQTALAQLGAVFRCLECHGAIRLHRAAVNGGCRAHAEHVRGFGGCSLGHRFDGRKRPNPQVVQAPEDDLGLPLLAEEIQTHELPNYKEGRGVQIVVNRYERDIKARKACLRHYGFQCLICHFDFERQYGAEGRGIIQVHHLQPLSNIGREYTVDPIQDLRPVCPNCHTIIHRRNPPYTIDEVKGMLGGRP